MRRGRPAIFGVNPARLVLVFGSGHVRPALAGWPGFFDVAGPAGQVTIASMWATGFTAIIWRFGAGGIRWAFLLAGGLMALTYIGGDSAHPNWVCRRSHSGVSGDAALFSFPAGV